MTKVNGNRVGECPAPSPFVRTGIGRGVSEGTERRLDGMRTATPIAPDDPTRSARSRTLTFSSTTLSPCARWSRACASRSTFNASSSARSPCRALVREQSGWANPPHPGSPARPGSTEPESSTRPGGPTVTITTSERPLDTVVQGPPGGSLHPEAWRPDVSMAPLILDVSRPEDRALAPPRIRKSVGRDGRDRRAAARAGGCPRPPCRRDARRSRRGRWRYCWAARRSANTAGGSTFRGRASWSTSCRHRVPSTPPRPQPAQDHGRRG